MELSKRILNMQESPIRKLIPYAIKAKAKGKKVYHLNIGQPDIPTPNTFFESIRNFNSDVLAYSYSNGLPDLINSMIEYYKSYNVSFNSEDILITNGGSEALLFSIIATCNEGDEVLVPEPYYTNYNGFANAVGVKIVPITTKAEDDFALPNISVIESLITDKTKAILICNPGNPTGNVFTEEELRTLIALSLIHNLYIISDEVYREFVYDGYKFISMGNFEEVKDRVIIIDSISKRFSACGARIGAIASKNEEVIANVLKLCQSRLCSATLEMTGAVALYNLDREYFNKIRDEYQSRRDLVYKRLSNMEDVKCSYPYGAFYIIATLPVDDSEKFIIWLLENFEINGETMMMAPASGFYVSPELGRNQVRIAYVLNRHNLDKAMDILEKGLIEYRKQFNL